MALEVTHGRLQTHFVFCPMSLLGRATSERRKHKPQPISHESYVGPVQSTRPLRGWVTDRLIESNLDYRTYFQKRYDRVS